jgi:hypothetical protein
MLLASSSEYQDTCFAACNRTPQPVSASILYPMQVDFDALSVKSSWLLRSWEGIMGLIYTITCLAYLIRDTIVLIQS